MCSAMAGVYLRDLAMHTVLACIFVSQWRLANLSITDKISYGIVFGNILWADRQYHFHQTIWFITFLLSFFKLLFNFLVHHLNILLTTALQIWILKWQLQWLGIVFERGTERKRDGEEKNVSVDGRRQRENTFRNRYIWIYDFLFKMGQKRFCCPCKSKLQIE